MKSTTSRFSDPMKPQQKQSRLIYETVAIASGYCIPLAVQASRSDMEITPNPAIWDLVDDGWDDSNDEAEKELQIQEELQMLYDDGFDQGEWYI